jgi:hypothetical protein
MQAICFAAEVEGNEWKSGNHPQLAGLIGSVRGLSLGTGAGTSLAAMQ